MASRKQTTLIIGIFFAAAAAVVGGVVALSSSYLNKSKTDANMTCKTTHANHTIAVQGDKATPAHITAPRCDTLTIKNLDDTLRIMAFGPHENHIPYDGVAERELGKNGSFTVTLVQTGNFRLHDHIHDEAQATFTVTN